MRTARPVRFVGSLMDITARKQLQDQVVRSQKMEAFGQLAGGVAHDFNNFLTTILGYSDLLLHELGLKGTNAQHIDEIRGAAQRASHLDHPAARFQPQASARAARRRGEQHHHESRAFTAPPARRKHHGRVPPASLGPRRAHQGRSRSAHADHPQSRGQRARRHAAGRTPHARHRHFPRRRRLASWRLPGATRTRRVCDDQRDRHGRWPERAKRKTHLFEPFFTTKDDGHSSGLGLATSYGIVRQSGGQMCVNSKAGRGTMITIYLPRVAAPPAAGYKKPGSKKLPTGNETILVVEDDVSVRHISVRVLRSLGYDVHRSRQRRRCPAPHLARRVEEDQFAPH